MRTFFSVLLFLAVGGQAVGDIFYRVDATGNYCVWIRDSARTISIKAELGAGSGDFAKDYRLTDATLRDTYGLTAAAIYPPLYYEVYATTAAAVTTADTPIAVGSFQWNGNQMLAPLTAGDATETLTVSSGTANADVQFIDGNPPPLDEEGHLLSNVQAVSVTAANEIFAALVANQTTAGSLGELLVNFLDAPVSEAGGIPVEDFAEEIFSDLRWTDVSDAALAIEGKLPSASAKIAGEGATAKNLDQIVASGGDGQPRVNKPPAPGYTLRASRRSDGTYRFDKPVRIRPGTVGDITVGLDLSPVYGSIIVESVDDPTVSGGSITAAAAGPRDSLAMVTLAGTATASETRTVDVPVTMDTGETETWTFEVKVFAD